MTLKNFEELEIWQLGRELRNMVYQLTQFFPSEEKFKLTDQIIRSSRSITANISEEFGRYHYQEFIQFCRLSRGSLNETLDHLICAYDCKYIDETTLNSYRCKIELLSKKINAFINYLKSAKNQPTDNK